MYLPSSGGVTRDTETLRAALEITPEDDELHWWLAEALREQGDTADAFVEYRWIIRNAPHRNDDVLGALSTCVERDREPETAHRLLADIYRRRGDASRASNHAALAMQSRRLSRVR
jgi:Tfp pilus assembly protein PilF